jgi:tRNA dimethylallyltransferase
MTKQVKREKLPKVLVILGRTATGKSDLAVRLAKKFNGEVVSSDSRQVYKGLNIGTGKITKKEMRGVPHYSLDVASPKRRFSVSQYKKLADKAIRAILQKNKLPIIVGGTGFYIQAVVDNVALPEVKPDHALRKKLEKKLAGELLKILKKRDPEKAREIDTKNPRRLIRAIEIAEALGKVPKILKSSQKYEVLQIGLETSNKKLKQKIKKRLRERIKKGMIAEAKRLHKQGLSFKRMRELGLEYKYLADFLEKKLSKEEMMVKLERAIWKCAKRQKTWFKKDKRIKWTKSTEQRKIKKELEKFLKRKDSP